MAKGMEREGEYCVLMGGCKSGDRCRWSWRKEGKVVDSAESIAGN